MKSDVTLAWAGSWVQQCLLRRAPQDDPFSYNGLALALLVYLLVDLLQARLASGWSLSLRLTLVDTLVVVCFTALVLLAARKAARLVQTLTALAGTGALLGLLGMPLMLHASRAEDGAQPSAAVAMGWLLLLIWSLTVQAHIFRHALSSWYGVGLLIAALHTVVDVSALRYFFPQVMG